MSSPSPKVIPLMSKTEADAIISKMPQRSSEWIVDMIQRNLGHSMPSVIDRLLK